MGVGSNDASLAEFREKEGQGFYAIGARPMREVKRRGYFLPFRLGFERDTISELLGGLKPDLVVASVGTPGLFISHLRGTKNALYVLHTYPGMRSRGRLYHAFRGLIIRLAMPRGIRFVTVSNFARKRMAKVWGLGLPPGKVQVVHNTAGPPLSNSVVQPANPIVLTIGHVVGYKNPDVWFAVAKKVLEQRPATRFVWVGPGPLLETYRSLANESDWGHRISFVGPQGDVNPYLRTASIYVQISRVESLGIAVLEAMRFGLPIVASGEGGLPELVLDGKNGFVVPAEEQNAIVRRIVFLLDFPGARAEMGASSLRRYDGEFCQKKWESRWDELHSGWV